MKTEDIFKATFNSREGKTMLYWILNECGYFSDSPEFVRPDLIAFANRLLQAGGVTSPARALRYIENLVATADMPIEERSDDDDIMEG